MMTLYSYFRSSTAYRVRIALNLKNAPYTMIPVNLLQGEQKSDAYRALNPLAGVPALDHDGFVLTQSLAMIDYLDDIFPEPSLWPGDAAERAYIRQMVQVIATEIHPLINLKTVNHLRDEHGLDDAARAAWMQKWMVDGMAAFETLLEKQEWCGDFVLDDRVSLADLCLIPQMYSLRRNKIDLSPYPHCRRIEAHCLGLKPFADAAPEMQPDAPDGLEQIHGPSFRAA